MHLPSFFVGSVATGAGFLLIHRELSHRQRLSSRWILAQEAEKEVTKLWGSARALSKNMSKPDTQQLDVSKYVADYRNKWNDGVSQVRDFAAKK